MGNPEHHREERLMRWLAAEAEGREPEAESALTDLFVALPRPALPPGFADRVLARVAAEPAPWPLERAAASLLLVCGLALAAAPLWLPTAWDRLDPAAWVAAAVELVVWLAHGLAAVATIGEGCLEVARWLSLAGGSPQVLTLLAASSLLAAGAGRLLFALLAEERSSGHAQA